MSDSAGGRLLGHRLGAVAVATLVGLALAFAFTPPAKADSNVDEAQFFVALNGVRARNGVPPLATDGQLINVARGWSAQMAGAGALSHNPSLSSQVTNWLSIGENVGTGSDVNSIEAALEASPHHFENMVDPHFNYVGIGVVESGGAIWVTEDFKQAKTGSLPSTQAPAPAPKPAPRAPTPSRSSPPAPSRSSAPSSAPRAHSSAVGGTAAAGAGSPSAGTPQASAQPVPNPTPAGSEQATSATGGHNPGALPAGLAVVSTSPVMDSRRTASLALFAVIGALAFLAVKGRLPGVVLSRSNRG